MKVERGEVAGRMEELFCALLELVQEAGGVGWEAYQVQRAAEYVDLYRQKVELGEDGWRVWGKLQKVLLAELPG